MIIIDITEETFNQYAQEFLDTGFRMPRGWIRVDGLWKDLGSRTVSDGSFHFSRFFVMVQDW